MCMKKKYKKCKVCGLDDDHTHMFRKPTPQKNRWTFLVSEQSVVDISSGPPVHVQVLNQIVQLNIPLKHLRTIANDFGGYIEVNLIPIKKKRV